MSHPSRPSLWELNVDTGETFTEGPADPYITLQRVEVGDLQRAARRGKRDLAKRQEQAREATRVREAKRGNWRIKARRLDAQLRANDPEAPRKARAAVIAERLRMSVRTVYDFLSDEPGR